MTLLRRAAPADVLLVLLAFAQQVELWFTRPDAHTVSVVVLTAMSTTALLARGRAPLAALLVSLAAHAALVQLMPAGMSTTFLALLATMVVAGTLSTGVAVVGLIGGFLVAFEGAWLDKYGGGLADFGMSCAVMAILWTAGWLVTRHRDAAEGAERVALEAQRARDRAAEEAVARERARVTRELHDVVAHGLTILVVQMVAAQEDLDHGADAGQLRERLRAGEQVARESLAELRTLLGVLKDAAPSSTEPTRGDLADLSSLVEPMRAAGFTVHLRVDGDDSLPVGVGLALRRVVQEGLTNVAKHAPGAEVDVAVQVTGEHVTAEVTDSGATRPVAGGPVSGHGLAGLRERVSMYDGRLEAGPGPDGGFRLWCALPLRGAERAAVGAPG